MRYQICLILLFPLLSFSWTSTVLSNRKHIDYARSSTPRYGVLSRSSIVNGYYKATKSATEKIQEWPRWGSFDSNLPGGGNKRGPSSTVTHSGFAESRTGKRRSISKALLLDKEKKAEVVGKRRHDDRLAQVDLTLERLDAHWRGKLIVWQERIVWI